jgi:glycosyltransferase involved in cell wall biosynthesis
VNILYHHRTLADGAEGIHIHEMAEAFRALGHRVTMQALARPAGPGQGNRGLGGVRRRTPQAIFECAAAALNLPEYLNVGRRLGSEHIHLLYKRHALLDVGAALAARRRRVPCVLEVNVAYSAPAIRQFEPVRLLHVVRRAERLALQSATLIVAVSTPLADYLHRLAGPDLPVMVLPNGVNQKMFDPAAADGSQVRGRHGLEGRFVIGWAGVLRRWHGIELLLEALAELPAANLLLIGDGPDRRLFEQGARERGLDRRLVVTGRVPHGEMPEHLAAVDVAVAADDRTGFASPMKIIEYMAMARPVVLPRLRNFEDIAQHDRTGLFFTPGDAADLARCVRLLQASAPLRERLGRAARAAVEQRLNWRHNAAAVLDRIGPQDGQPRASSRP